MNRWFQKGNSRRFFRIDMPVRVFITPSSPIKDREIYATGIDYYPATRLALIETQKNSTIQWVDRIQDQKELISKIFDEMIDSIQFFGKCAESISKGINPKLDPSYWMEVSTRLKGFQTISALQISSPKTYTYFKLIEEKYLTFLQAMANSISKSTPTSYASNFDLPYGFKLDETLEIFKKPKFSKVPLAQSIINLSEYLDTYLDAYRSLNDDNMMRQYPEEWKLQQANVSASGIALMMNKRFTAFERVDVFFYFEDIKKAIKFDGAVVDIRSIEDIHRERIAINFEFPDGDSQQLLQNEIQRFELEECMSLKLH